VGPRTGLETEDRGKILCPCRDSNVGRPVVQPVIRHYTSSTTEPPVLNTIIYRLYTHATQYIIKQTIVSTHEHKFLLDNCAFTKITAMPHNS
jgi:hypothetical protein